MAVPDFLEKREDTPIQQMYHGKLIQLWKGEVPVSVIEGWVDNPRIEMAVKRLRATLGDRQEVTQDMVYKIMKEDDDVDLKNLKDNIVKNGLRVPLVLSFRKKLIDGNRRFFAVKYALEEGGDEIRERLSRVPALVLTDDARDDYEERIIVEENFTPSHKKDWPHYVKARQIQKARDNGLTPEKIRDKFGLSISEVREILQILGVIEDFMVFAIGKPDPEEPGGGGLGISEDDAEAFIAKGNRYQYFNEAKKSLRDDLRRNPEFQACFFRWLYEGKYNSFAEVRLAFQAFQDEEARHIMETKGKGAGKQARARVENKNYDTKDDKDVEFRVSEMVQFLNKLNAEQMLRMPQGIFDKLREALEAVIKMTQSGKK